LVYTDFSAPGEEDTAIRGSIYLFETLAATVDLEATCLVIGGIYENDLVPTYYRVDFLENDHITHKNILRNHEYTVNITEIKDRGHGTFEEAFEGKAVNMIVEILNWGNDNIDVIFDGQFYLSVNKSLFNFSRETCTERGDNNILSVMTDYKSSVQSGWYIEKITGADGVSPVTWLTVTAPNGTINANATGEADVQADLILTYSKNEGAGNRIAKIVFGAGRLRYTVEVVQTTRIGVSIRFFENYPATTEIDTLVVTNKGTYYGGVFTVHWTPALSDLNVWEDHEHLIGPILSKFAIDPPLRVIKGVIAGVDGEGNSYGEYNYQVTIIPQENPLGSGTTSLGFYVSNGVEILEKKIVIKYVAAP
jgi:hypothetical protein